MELKPPLVIASGVGGMGEYLQLIDSKYIGAYTLKTITLFPKQGNPPPRLFANQNYLINNIGLENIGIDAFVENLLSDKYVEIFDRTKVIFSLGGDSPDEYKAVAEKIAPHERYFEAIEVNFSCPNVKEGGLNILSDLSSFKDVLSCIRKTLKGFLIAKVGIEGAFVEKIAQIVEDHGWNGITLINTVRGLEIVEDRIIKGGLSGPLLKPIALRAVYEVKNKAHKLYVIGSGGIMCEKDVDDFFKVGANAISLGTAVYKNPMIVERIAEHIWRCYR
ncbi:MAG: tRNA-dihydrouridine synthase [Pseudothermotoga sp.]